MEVRTPAAEFWRAGIIVGVGALIVACGKGPGQPTPVPTSTPPPVVIQGSVSDTAFMPLSGATVEVVDGPDAGRKVTASESGAFNISGNFTSATLFRASKAGLLDAVQTFRIHPFDGYPWLPFKLPSPFPPVDVSGDYTVTFEPECAGLPDGYKSRTYPAHVVLDLNSAQPPNTLFAAVLGDSALATGFDRFSVGVAGNAVGLAVHPPNRDDWGVVEQLPGNAFVAFSGQATGITAGPQMSANWVGYTLYCVLPSAGTVRACSPTATTFMLCESKLHRITLSRTNRP